MKPEHEKSEHERAAEDYWIWPYEKIAHRHGAEALAAYCEKEARRGWKTNDEAADLVVPLSKILEYVGRLPSREPEKPETPPK